MTSRKIFSELRGLSSVEAIENWIIDHPADLMENYVANMNAFFKFMGNGKTTKPLSGLEFVYVRLRLQPVDLKDRFIRGVMEIAVDYQHTDRHFNAFVCFEKTGLVLLKEAGGRTHHDVRHVRYDIRLCKNKWHRLATSLLLSQ